SKLDRVWNEPRPFLEGSPASAPHVGASGAPVRAKEEKRSRHHARSLLSDPPKQIVVLELRAMLGTLLCWLQPGHQHAATRVTVETHVVPGCHHERAPRDREHLGGPENSELHLVSSG